MLGVVLSAFNPSTWEVWQADLWEFEANLVYKVSYRTAKTVTKRNPDLKNH